MSFKTRSPEFELHRNKIPWIKIISKVHFPFDYQPGAGERNLEELVLMGLSF